MSSRTAFFSTFATPDKPVTAFTGLTAPALTRCAGFYTHVTLHHIIEHVDFSAAGVRRERLFRLGAEMATKTLLRANSVSVLLPGYYRTLSTKYRARNVLLGTHGTFAPALAPPDFSKRGNPDQRILAFGHWGTYKRLETLMQAFPQVVKKAPRAKLIVAGANHYADMHTLTGTSILFTTESRAAVRKQLDDKVSRARTDEAKAELHAAALATAKSRAK